MRMVIFSLSCSALLLALAVVSTTVLAQPGAASDDARRLHALFAAEWDYDMQADPLRASTLGDRRWNDRWPDVRLATYARRLEHDKDVLARLARIDRRRLTPDDQLNYDLFRHEYDTRIEESGLRWYLLPLNQRDGLQTRSDLAEVLRFETVKDYEDWLARLRSFPEYADGTIELLREGVRARLLQPKVIMQRVVGQVQKQIVGTPEESPFYEPFRRVPEIIPPAERDRLTSAAREVIATAVVPAFERFHRFLVQEYLPAAYDSAGIWQAPGGETVYAFFARKYTTTRLTPKEIHEIGLREVERIRAAMQALMDRQGFKGTLLEFFTFLRTDPRFYYKTPEELLAAYRAIAKRVDPALVKVFGTLPRMPYGVEPIPELTAPDTTTAYYQQPALDGSRAGIFYVNLYKPETRPTYEMMALALHEAVPGHHLQIALNQERGDLPMFRRNAEYTVFVEGWALYGESLGEEMGLYDDPYSKFGQLTYDMWRAVRLVVDTGIHVMRWDRQKAIDFFKAHAAKTENDIVNEIDRYIAWPGQALAYKIGELKIKELRRRAEQRLGPRFDVRKFHDTVLLDGAVPLDILEARIERWMTAAANEDPNERKQPIEK